MREREMIGRVMVVLAVVAFGCGSRGDPGPIDAGADLARASADAAPPEGGLASDGAIADTPASGATDASGDGTPSGLAVAGRLFPEGSAWYRDVSTLPADVESPAMIAALGTAGFGMGEMLVDFTFEVVTADGTAPLSPLVPGPDFSRPDCDEQAVPIAMGGALRDEASYQCTKNGECHLLVVQPATHRLFEMWKANLASGVLTAGCLAVWDLGRVYGPSGRGTDCASADSSGMPITPLLFTADEVAAGEIPHAVRLSLPTDRIRPGVYLTPATHSTRAATGGPSALPLGARLRLRPDFPLETLTPGARVVAKALQRYGMLLAEGGPKALTARSDRSTTARWAGLLGDRDLVSIKPADFAVVDSGARIPYKGDCSRVP
jgi:hypothetical protein